MLSAEAFFAVAFGWGAAFSFVWSPPCEACGDGLRCHPAMSADSKLSVAAALISVLLFLVTAQGARRVMGDLPSGIGALIVALPSPPFLGICEVGSMACHTTTHWLDLWGAGLVLTGLFFTLVGRLEPIVAEPPYPWDGPLTAAHRI
jgi:hypothetical protein